MDADMAIGRSTYAWLFCVTLSIVSATLRAQESAPASEAPPAAPGTTGVNLDMKLDDLVKQVVVVPGFSQVVNTFDRQESMVGHSLTAVFVITPEMTKWSGARNILDFLRMALGVDVARIDAHSWATSIRGPGSCLGWQATDSMEVNFAGQNLSDSHHPEFLDGVAGYRHTSQTQLVRPDHMDLLSS
jgi:hypothetical protein